jgi:hypothetical protein
MFSGYIAGWFTGTLMSPHSAPASGFIVVYNFGSAHGNLPTSVTSSGSNAPNTVDWNTFYVSSITYKYTPFALAYFYQSQIWFDANYVSQPSSGNIAVA